MIFTVVFLCILAFFVALFTIRVRVTLEMTDELSLSVLAFGVKINVLPKKQKKYNINDYTPKKIAKRDKKAAKKAALKAKKKSEKAAKKKQKKTEDAKLTKAEKKAQKAKKKAKRPPIPDMLSLFLKIIKMFFSGLFSKFHFHVARIRISVGASDAATTAMLCTFVCASINPILNFLDKHSNLHGRKNADIAIVPDYLSEEFKFDVKLAFSTSIGGLLGVLLRSAFSFIFGWLKITPSSGQSVSQSSETSSSQKSKSKKTSSKNRPKSNDSSNKKENISA